jgi:hypothetical protein
MIQLKHGLLIRLLITIALLLLILFMAPFINTQPTDAPPFALNFSVPCSGDGPPGQPGWQRPRLVALPNGQTSAFARNLDGVICLMPLP